MSDEELADLTALTADEQDKMLNDARRQCVAAVLSATINLRHQKAALADHKARWSTRSRPAARRSRSLQVKTWSAM